jgi:hypothetical protein
MNYYSNIYWHFTGSPKNIEWNLIYCPKDIRKYGAPKTDRESLDILKSIISSETLLAKAKESIDTHIISETFCCVTDIPIQNLEEHKPYYGNVVIGFKHGKIHKNFNPVLYIPKNILPVRSKNTATSFAITGDLLTLLKNVYSPENVIDEDKIGSYLINHFKITSFSDKSEETFYREREWRKIGNFNFKHNDIAVIIVPSRFITDVKKMLANIESQDISIMTWELLKKM